MKIRQILLLLAGCLLLGACAGLGTTTFVVDTEEDHFGLSDYNPGDGICGALNELAEEVCSLRAAIEESNANVNPNRIVFDESVQTIDVRNSLPPLGTGHITIDGAGRVTIQRSENSGSPQDYSVGIDITSTSNVIQGLTITGFGIGIRINGDQLATNNIIGVASNDNSDSNLGNTITNNLSGIVIEGPYAIQNTIAGNLVTDNVDLDLNSPSNYVGILAGNGVSIVSGAHNNVIGGSGAAGGNGSPPELDMTDLVSHWLLDESSGSAIDAAGNNDLVEHNLVGSGPGKVDGARVFDAAGSDYFSHTDNASLSTGDIDFSVAAWVQLADLPSGPMYIAGKEDNNSTREFDFVIVAGGQPSFAIFDSSGAQVGRATSGTSLTPGIWYHLVGYHDASTNEVGIIVNGGASATANTSGAPSDTSASFRIGARRSSAQYFFDGLIDDVTFWKRLLSPDEINTLAGLSSGGGSGGQSAGNVISGNEEMGVYIDNSEGNWITGNLIGVSPDGLAAMGNGRDGIHISHAANNRVGIDENGEGEGNVISGNAEHGMLLNGVTETSISGNLVGLAPDGGAAMANLKGGIYLSGSNGNTIGLYANGQGAGNVLSGNGTNLGPSAGLLLINSNENFIAGNFIGTNITGTAAVANTGNGIEISTESGNNIIGTNSDGLGDAAEGNLISGNLGGPPAYGHGVRISGKLNIVAGNYIGTDISGSSALPNRVGVWILNDANRIGTNGDGQADDVEGNLISGNQRIGIIIASSSNTVAGNLVGTDISGLNALGNGGSAITLDRYAFYNRIGTNGDGANDDLERNLLSANGTGYYGGKSGVDIYGSFNMIAGNYIGTDATGLQGLGNLGDGIRFEDTAVGNVIGSDGALVEAQEGNLISGNGGLGIESVGGISNWVSGNWIGIDLSGAAALPNSYGGIRLRAGSSDNVIGNNGDGNQDASERNVISGNPGPGVLITGVGSINNTVAGNYIGTDASGTTAVANDTGVIVTEGAADNLIGTNDDGFGDAAEGNLISGNTGAGLIFTRGASSNEVAGNYIGTDASGAAALGNGYAGITVSSGLSDISDILIGGSPTKANVIAFNGEAGVRITGNPADDVYPVSNPILYNSIHSNDSIGIELALGGNFSGISLNDPGDVDGGSNLTVNYPDLIAAEAVGSTVSIDAQFVDGLPNTTFTVQFFANSVCDGPFNFIDNSSSTGQSISEPISHGEGEIYIGESSEATDGNGNASFTVNLNAGVSPGEFITATATDPNNNTSEFSACIEVTGPEALPQETHPPLTITPTRDLNCRYACTTVADIADTLFAGTVYIPLGWDATNRYFAFEGPAFGELCFAPPESFGTQFMSINLDGIELTPSEITSEHIASYACPAQPTATPTEATGDSGGGTTPPTNTPVPAQCSDGIDNDGDGAIDYGSTADIAAGRADRQCSSPDDNDESN